MDQMNSIEKQEIRGMSWRNLITLFMGFGTVLASILGTYYSLVHKIDTQIIERQAYEKGTTTDIQTMKGEISTMKATQETQKGDIQYLKMLITK